MRDQGDTVKANVVEQVRKILEEIDDVQDIDLAIWQCIAPSPSPVSAQG